MVRPIVGEWSRAYRERQRCFGLRPAKSTAQVGRSRTCAIWHGTLHKMWPDCARCALPYAAFEYGHHRAVFHSISLHCRRHTSEARALSCPSHGSPPMDGSMNRGCAAMHRASGAMKGVAMPLQSWGGDRSGTSCQVIIIQARNMAGPRQRASNALQCAPDDETIDPQPCPIEGCATACTSAPTSLPSGSALHGRLGRKGQGSPSSWTSIAPSRCILTARARRATYVPIQ